MRLVVYDSKYRKDFDGFDRQILFSDLPKNLQEDDIIEINRFEDDTFETIGCTRLDVLTKRLETDDEYQKRISESKFQQDTLKKRRYETYIKLKKEFEDEEE